MAMAKSAAAERAVQLEYRRSGWRLAAGAAKRAMPQIGAGSGGEENKARR